MIKKFEEFVNEGLITDYKKQEEEKSREISESEKKFVFELLNKFEEVEMPFVFTCKNCAVISDSVNKDKVNEFVERNNIHNLKDLKDEYKDVHISHRSMLKLLEKDHEWLGKNEKYKNIWGSIYKWFDKKFKDNDDTFGGKIRVETILEWKNDIKKDLF